MTNQLAKLTGEWSTSVLPTQTTLTHIDPTHIYGVVETLLSISSALPTVTKNLDLYHMARAAKGAKASLLVISAQYQIATATNTQNLPLMTQIIWNATMELQDLEKGFNLYQMDLSFLANLVFAVIFAIILVVHIGIGAWRKHVYFSVCVCIGVALEFSGYVARLMSIGNYSDKVTYLTQIISLTLAPAFIMAGVYFLLAQLLAIYGRQYSRIPPLWFSYIFIFCDVSSLAIQSGGGGLTAIRLQNLESLLKGTHIIVSGIAIQVVSMTLFLYLFFDFLYRIYFRASPEVKFLVRNFFSLIFQTSRGRRMTENHLNANYNPKFEHIWTRRSFGYYPLVLFLSVLFIYIRCVYRLVELSEGWTGYLITHEEYVMSLDAMMVLITCIMLAPFHPGIMMGANSEITMKEIKTEADLETTEKGSNNNYGFQQRQNHQSRQDQYQNDYSYRRLMDSFRSDSDLEKDDVKYFERQVSSSSADTLASSSPQMESVNVYNYHSRVVTPPPVARKGPFEDGGIISMPYESTTSTPRQSVSDLSRGTSRKSKKTYSRRQALVPSFNPYERIHEGKLSTYGPYEQYSTRLEEVDDENPFSDAHADVESQISNDEFLFTFDNK